MIFFFLLWLAMLAFAAWVHFDTATPEKDYRLALCDRWHEGRWFFHEDAHEDYMENFR